MCDKDPIVPIDDYECFSPRNNLRDTEDIAVEVAVYRKLQSATTCRPMAVTVASRIRCTNDIVDDVFHIKVAVDS